MSRTALLLGLMFLGNIGCDSAATPSAQKSSSRTGTVAPSDAGPHYSKQLSEASFEADVLKSPQVVMVDCWAPWCGPCVQLGPTIEEVAKEFEGRAVVGKLNVDEAGSIAQRYQISLIPTLLFFKNGEVVDQLVGPDSKEVITAKLTELIAQ